MPFNHQDPDASTPDPADRELTADERSRLEELRNGTATRRIAHAAGDDVAAQLPPRRGRGSR